MMPKDPCLSHLGICAKAGMISSGEFSVEEAVKRHKASLVVIAEDASENTKKRFVDACTKNRVEYRVYGTGEVLGRSVGKELRKVLAVTDKKMADSLMIKMDDELRKHMEETYEG